MASFQAIMINDLTDPEKFTRKHLLNMHAKYRNIWNAFKINEFSIQYKAEKESKKAAQVEQEKNNNNLTETTNDNPRFSLLVMVY